MNDKNDLKYMKRALALAKKGEGSVNPNPLVGAVIVKDRRIIGEGYHEQYGGPHAEVNAFNHATESVEGATMYVTLEPCAHYGKTPPCALKIIEKKIKKVIVAKTDPNPLVNMKGIELLREAGIEVEYGLLANQVEKQNEIFLKYIQTKTPFVALKYAMTLDGKIATYTHDSKWITNEKSRTFVHRLRRKYSAIMVGANTIIDDDAHLDVRLSKQGRQPTRIIIDPHGRIPHDAYVIETALSQPTIIVSYRENESLKARGVKFIVLPEPLDLQVLMQKLGEIKIDSVLIEGGAFTHAQALEQGIVDKVYAFIAPKLIGGKDALSPITGRGIALINDAKTLKDLSYHYFDEDILIEGTIIKE